MNHDWPYLLADMKAKRAALDQVIATIETHFLPVDGAMPESPMHSARGGRRLAKRARIIPKKLHRRRAVKRTDGRTDGRTEQNADRRGQRGASLAPRSLPNQKGEAIIAEIRRQGGATNPGTLAKALGLNAATLRYQLKPLLQQKLVVATGATMNRQISLPGKSPKEDL